MPEPNYFNNSYEESRTAFLNAVQKVKYSKTISEALPVNEPKERMYIDIVHLKSTGLNPLVIITSGLHGIEGYAGSALQISLLNQLANRSIDMSGIDLLLIHAINPWGFKYKRRVTQNNVDLNRNFSTTSDLFKTKNLGYSKIRSILEPTKKYSRRSLGDFTFLLKILKNIQKYSKQTLVQAIGEGQYEFSKGIIFGGKDFEEENEVIAKTLQKYCEPYKKMLIIDLHTGLGKRGKLQLLNAPKVPNYVKQQVNELFDNRIVDDNDSNFFKEHGSFLDFVYNINKDKVCFPIMFEFGTINSENILGALRTLKTMIVENQAYHYGCKTSSDKAYISEVFMEMFCPKDPAWRIDIVNQFLKIMLFVIPKIKN